MTDKEGHLPPIGREKEVDILEEKLGQTKKGKGNLVFLSGEVGIGKATLYYYLNNRYSGEATFLDYYCSRGKKHPYQPFLTLLKATLKADIGQIAKKGVREALSEMEFAAKASAGGDIKKNKDRLFMTVTDGFLSAATDIPLIIFIDNLHWADKDSLGYLHYLTKNTQKSKIMILSAYQPEEMDEEDGGMHPLMELLGEMMMEQLFVTIPLERLDKENVGKLVKELLSRDDISQEFIDLVYSDTQGNPFFVNEVIGSLLKDGTIDPTDQDWPQKLDLSQIKVPSTIKEAIFDRLSKLNEKTREVLDTAAVLGVTFELSNLSSLTGEAPDMLSQVLYELTENKIIVPDMETEGRYTFDHSKIQEIIENELGDNGPVLHGGAGKILEDANLDDPGTVAYDLAYHFSKANDSDKALIYSRLAADKALKENAPVEARRYMEMALSSIGPIDDPENARTRLAILLKVANIENTTGDWKQSKEHYEEAEKLSESIGDLKSRAEAARNIGHIWREKSQWDKAEECYDASLKLSEEIGDDQGLADTYRGLGKINWRHGEYGLGKEHFNRAIDYADKAGDQIQVGIIKIELGNIYGDTGDYETAINTYKESIETLQKVNDLGEVARAYNNMGEQYKYMGNLEKAIECYEKCIQNAKSGGDIRTMGYGLLNAAECYAKVGKLEIAKDYSDRTMKIFQKLNEKYVISGVFMVYGLIDRFNKDYESAVKNLQTTEEMLIDLEVKYDLGVNYAEFGRLYAEMGEKEKALEKFEKGLDIFESVGSKVHVERVKKEIEELQG